VTVDFETIEKDGTFTLRDRDTLQQVRVNETELLAMLDEKTA
jgi:glycyl-tRNA synthetase